MNNQVLIRLIKELKKSKLVPSEKKTAVLANFNEKQVELFLNLKENGFISQSNLNYAIGEISKIKELGPVSNDAVRELWNDNNPNLNRDILKFILHELQYNPNIGVTNINKLLEIYQNDSYFISYFLETIEIIDSSKLRNLGLIGAVLDAYREIYNTTTNPRDLIARLNSIILDQDILSSLQSCDKEQVARNYGQMLREFILFIDNENFFDKVKEMISHLARNKKLDIDDATNLVYSCSKLKDSENFGYLESILMKKVSWGSISTSVSVLNKYKQDAKNNANLAWLTELVSKKLSERFSPGEIKQFYHELVTILNSDTINESLTMEDINFFIDSLLYDSDFIYYLQKNGLGFIECAFKCGKDDFDAYLELSVKVNMLDELELYERLLNSFTPSLDCEQLKVKQTVYNNQEVIEVICENPKVLRILNKIIDDERFTASEEELDLLCNLDFLKSDFFQKKYVPLVCDTFSSFRMAPLEYRKNFFKVLSTLDFNDPNLSFYVNSLLTKKDADELAEIYISRCEDEAGAFADISTSLYEILSSNDDKQLEEYLAMLKVAPNHMDIKADTKVVYQKQIGKKKN